MEAEIVIRKARRFDINEIWRLLHNENMAWDDDKILREIDRLYLLTYGNKLLSILHGSFIRGSESVSFVAVHPMYPEDSLRSAVIHSLLGIVCRRPRCDIEQLKGCKNGHPKMTVEQEAL